MKKLLLALFAATAMIFGLASCSGDLHDGPATIKLTVPGDGSTINIINAGGAGVVVDGSLFGWSGGSAETCTGYGPVFEVTATAEQGSWVDEENPWTGTKEGCGKLKAFPEGADTAAKLKIGGDEGWICFKTGGTYTFDWNERQ